MSTITSINNYRTNHLGSIFCSTLCLVTHNDCIYTHSFHSVQGISQAFTLDNTAGASGNVHHISSKIFACQLEGGTGSGTWLVEQSHNRLAPQGWYLLDITMNDILHFLGCFQNHLDFISRKVGQSQNIPASERHAVFSQSNHSFLFPILPYSTDFPMT